MGKHNISLARCRVAKEKLLESYDELFAVHLDIPILLPDYGHRTDFHGHTGACACAGRHLPLVDYQLENSSHDQRFNPFEVVDFLFFLSYLRFHRRHSRECSGILPGRCAGPCPQ